MSPSPPIVHKRFEFGTVFGDGGKVLARQAVEKKAFTPDEVEVVRAQAYADGEASAMARAQMAQAAAIQALADAAHQGLGTVNEMVNHYKRACVDLALICAQKIAAEALDRFPEAPVVATLEALGQEIETTARLVVHANAPSEELKAAAMEAGAYAGFAGQIQFRDKPSFPKGAFEIVWSDGRAEFNPHQVVEALEKALHEALEADAYHQSRGRHDGH
ncbi:flagellar assembly protein FliH [Asticcacaulis sp. AC402]|uniref:flagellar assembly protein FliH n=1 Tax=Asticcacaulis sp. AC402 TaxID=1282361 RepID=UPI0003C3C722|nr:flagellar assembly protein FliH [Asticcacaulis sp. AC402]ESQ76016.1 flagellar assembly protein FliH [Asticcacaulis sp. AC402]